MNSDQANFSVGQLIQHRLFEYRGVVVDVDPHFLGSEDWYRQMAHSRPPKDRPWYTCWSTAPSSRPTWPNAT